MALALVPHAVESGSPWSVAPLLLPVTLVIAEKLDALKGTPTTGTKLVVWTASGLAVVDMLVTQVTAFAGPAGMTACKANVLALARSSRLPVEATIRADARPPASPFLMDGHQCASPLASNSARRQEGTPIPARPRAPHRKRLAASILFLVHRKLAPLTNTQCDSGTIGRSLCGVALGTSSVFRRFCAIRSALIGFFSAMLQKDHAAECQFRPESGFPLAPDAAASWILAPVSP